MSFVSIGVCLDRWLIVFSTASFDWRVREEVHRCAYSLPLAFPFALSYRSTTHSRRALHSDAWCRGPPTHFYHQFRHDLLQRLGHRWSGEVRWATRWILHPRPMRDHHVRRHVSYHVQERAQLVPRPRACLREHPHRALW